MAGFVQLHVPQVGFASNVMVVAVNILKEIPNCYSISPGCLHSHTRTEFGEGLKGLNM